MEFFALSGKKDNKSQVYEDSCYEFLHKHHEEDLLEILETEEDKAHYHIMVDYVQLYEDNPVVGDTLLRAPDIILEHFDKAAKRALIDKYEQIPKDPKAQVLSKDSLKFKLNVHIRVKSLPVCAQLYRLDFPSCKESGSFLCVVGTVVRVSTAKLLEYSKTYQCNRCKNTVETKAPASRYHAFPKTVECPNLCVNAKVTSMGDSNSKNAENYSKFRDYQEIKLQEQVQKMDFGCMPKALTVVLEDDLVNYCKPGDDVAITGTLYLRWKPFKPGQPAESELVCRANYIQNNNDQRASVRITDEMSNCVENFWHQYQHNPFEGRNHIIASFCPQIYGMYVVKLAMCMVLAGGVSREVAGTRIRGECHMLLVGDPGTGKSQLLKYASKISPRSVMTTGIGTSSAGLTVSAVKDGGEWHLEAGALVLADGGVCCIDEFSCIKEHDRTSIHEAMEQQSISIAKAGMVVKVPTRVTIIAATNPKGKYDPEQPLSINIAIASPLLSRFDILMVLTDVQNDAWDSFISDFILLGKDAFSETMKNSLSELWDFERLQSYLVHIKELNPQMSAEANEVISEYYKYQRSLEERNAARTTVRLLESLRRLSQGHARLMFRSEVLLHDAITAISLIEASMQSSSIVDAPNSLHTTFPSDSMDEYENQAELILTKLNLTELWEKELVYLNSLKSKRKPKGLTVISASSVSSSQANQSYSKRTEDAEPIIVASSYSFTTKKAVIPESESGPRVPISPTMSSAEHILQENQISSEKEVDSQVNPLNLPLSSSQRNNSKRSHSSSSSSSSSSSPFRLNPIGSDEDMFGSCENEPLFQSTNRKTQEEPQTSCPNSVVRMDATGSNVRDEFPEPSSPPSSLTPRRRERKKAIQQKLSRFKRVRRAEDDD